MIVRSAILEGTVAPDRRAAFDAHMADVVLPAIAAYPGLRKVALRTPVESDGDAPAIHVVFDLYFDDLAAMHAALASPVRQQVRTVIAAGMGDFKGKVYHVVYDEGRTLAGKA
jgi:uncharacterized protein (TIGR02118 family)